MVIREVSIECFCSSLPILRASPLAFVFFLRSLKGANGRLRGVCKWQAASPSNKVPSFSIAFRHISRLLFQVHRSRKLTLAAVDNCLPTWPAERLSGDLSAASAVICVIGEICGSFFFRSSGWKRGHSRRPVPLEGAREISQISQMGGISGPNGIGRSDGSAQLRAPRRLNLTAAVGGSNFRRHNQVSGAEGTAPTRRPLRNLRSVLPEFENPGARCNHRGLVSRTPYFGAAFFSSREEP